MIKNFAELKKELSELAGVVNSFKSEAVQLRIVDLVFRGVEIPEEEEGDPRQERQTTQRRGTSRKTKKSTTNGTSAKKDEKKPGRGGRRAGAAAILTQLIDEGFFKTKRTINAIIDHAGKKKARKFKANELSGPLARFVRDGRLDRDPNKDGQYEYFTK
jgi:hypothetical protein